MSKRATYADLEQVPEGRVVELIDGVLWTQARPAAPHAVAASWAMTDLAHAFRRGGSPGGWVVLTEPELWLGEDEPNELVLVPDIGAWRQERFVMPAAGAGVGITVPPDFLAEILSPSTSRHDRLRKLPLYAHAGVGHVWLIDPIAETVEVFELRSGVYAFVDSAEGDIRARLVPFDAVELEVGGWWPSRLEQDAPTSSDP